MTISVLEILAILTRISFTSTIADFIFIALFYLGICFGIWILVSANNAILRNTGRLLGVLVFGANYLLSTVGALGLAFVLNDWTPQQEINLDKNLEYREISLGMANDDYRGKRVEIFREIGFLPLERQIMQKVYINEIPWSARKLEVKYNKQAGELYLSAAVTGRDNTIRNWKVTIKIN